MPRGPGRPPKDAPLEPNYPPRTVKKDATAPLGYSLKGEPRKRKLGDRAGMSCPLCHERCKTIDVRGYWYDDCVRRRRECLVCGHRFTTYEQMQIRGDIVVTKRDGDREPFDIQKLKKSLAMALAKRNITPERIQRMALSISDALNTVHADTEYRRKTHANEYRLVSSAYVGALAMESLKALDPVGYVRYASIHRRFHSLDDYQRILDTFEH